MTAIKNNLWKVFLTNWWPISMGLSWESYPNDSFFLHFLVSKHLNFVYKFGLAEFRIQLTIKLLVFSSSKVIRSFIWLLACLSWHTIFVFAPCIFVHLCRLFVWVFIGKVFYDYFIFVVLKLSFTSFIV